MPVDPHVQALLEQLEAQGMPPFEEMSVPQSSIRCVTGPGLRPQADRAGVEVTSRTYDGVIHDFLLVSGVVDRAGELIAWLGTELRARRGA